MVVANGVVFKWHIAKFLRAIQNQAVGIWHESRNLDFFRGIVPTLLESTIFEDSCNHHNQLVHFFITIAEQKTCYSEGQCSAMAFVRYHISSHSS